MEDSVRQALIVAVLFLVVGLGYFAAEMINLLKPGYLPLNVQWAVQATFPNDFLDDMQIIGSIPQAVMILISVFIWIEFLLLGIMGIYMRQVAKISTA